MATLADLERRVDQVAKQAADAMSRARQNDSAVRGMIARGGGPPGPTGEGSPGPTGPAGADGATGPTGPSGAGGVTMAQVYPVGCIYLSTNSTNPATSLGFGTWAAFGAGRVPVGFNGSDGDFDTDEETGGAKTITPTGSNSAPAISGSVAAITAGTPAGTNSAPTFTGSAAQATSAVSAGTPAGTNSAPTFTGSAAQATSAVSAGTPAGTNSAPTFTGAALGTHAHELPFIKGAGGTVALRMLAQSVFGSGTSRAPESISANPTANTTAAAVALSQAVSAGTPSGTVSAPTFTGNALGTHQHTLTPAGTVSAPTFTGDALGTHQHTLTPAGTVSAPTFTGNALGTHLHGAGTLAASAPTFTGNAHSIVQPYIVVRMWKRTA